MPPASSAEREEERRLNTRTLTIASVASATAAAVTSQLWIAGTWLAAAFTPVLVALISEAMHRPTERIARAWTSEREPRRSAASSPTRREPTAVTGTPGPVRVYRQSGSRTSSMLTKRRIAIGTVAATAAIAFVVGIVALTTVDLVSGGSVGKGSGRSTLFSGGGSGGGNKQEQPQQNQDTAPDQQRSPEQQESTPAEPPATTEPAPDTQQPPSDTAPVPPPTETPPAQPLPETPTSP
jgi:predicted outer membrane lipoprotein